MKFSECRRFKTAVVGDVITLARGETAITFPSVELADVIAALQGLLGAPVAVPAPQPEPVRAEPRVPEPPAAPETESLSEPEPVVQPAPPVEPEPEPAASPDPERGPRNTTSKAKPGQVWTAIQEYLRGKERPQGEAAILTALAAAGHTDSDRPARIVLAHRTTSGDLIKTGAGRFKLGGDDAKQPAQPAKVPAPEPEPAKPERVPEPEPPPAVEATPPAKKQKPGVLWAAMSEYLATRPKGARVDELVRLAGERKWTNASNLDHAVRASLTRIGPDKVTVNDKGVAKLVR